MNCFINTNISSQLFVYKISIANYNSKNNVIKYYQIKTGIVLLYKRFYTLKYYSSKTKWSLLSIVAKQVLQVIRLNNGYYFRLCFIGQDIKRKSSKLNIILSRVFVRNILTQFPFSAFNTYSSLVVVLYQETTVLFTVLPEFK